MDSVENETIRARSIHLVDENGEPRLVLAANSNEGGLALLDRNGTVRAQLVYIQGDDFKLMFSDAKGVGRAQLTLGADGVAALTLFHDNDRPHFMLASNGKGDGDMFFVDAGGKSQLWSAF